MLVLVWSLQNVGWDFFFFFYLIFGKLQTHLVSLKTTTSSSTLLLPGEKCK